MRDPLTVYGQAFPTHILLGTARYESPKILVEAINAADPAMVTVALRKQLQGGLTAGQSFWEILRNTKRSVLPNTAGCHTVKEAVNTALMGRELFETDFLKLEVIGDDQTLQPDPFGLVEAATKLVQQGFRILPYCTDDFVLCKRLLDAGCDVLMPWAAPIGTGQGPRNPKALRELHDRLPDVTLIIDAGLGLPSHACQVMEWGFDGVLVNTAVSRAIDPITMAKAFASATQAGRSGYLAGPIPVQDLAVASTPEIGKPFWDEACPPRDDVAKACR